MVGNHYVVPGERACTQVGYNLGNHRSTPSIGNPSRKDTVNHHACSILRKLEVHSRGEAVAAAFGLGILKTTDTGQAVKRTRA